MRPPSNLDLQQERRAPRHQTAASGARSSGRSAVAAVASLPRACATATVARSSWVWLLSRLALSSALPPAPQSLARPLCGQRRGRGSRPACRRDCAREWSPPFGVAEGVAARHASSVWSPPHGAAEGVASWRALFGARLVRGRRARPLWRASEGQSPPQGGPKDAATRRASSGWSPPHGAAEGVASRPASSGLVARGRGGRRGHDGAPLRWLPHVVRRGAERTAPQRVLGRASRRWRQSTAREARALRGRAAAGEGAAAATHK